jgi:hypothetical protein
MALIQRKEEVVTDLISCFDSITEQEANTIYGNAMTLFHTLFTITDFNLLLTTDERVLSALVVLLINSIDLEKSNWYEH